MKNFICSLQFPYSKTNHNRYIAITCRRKPAPERNNDHGTSRIHCLYLLIVHGWPNNGRINNPKSSKPGFGFDLRTSKRTLSWHRLFAFFTWFGQTWLAHWDKCEASPLTFWYAVPSYYDSFWPSLQLSLSCCHFSFQQQQQWQYWVSSPWSHCWLRRQLRQSKTHILSSDTLGIPWLPCLSMSWICSFCSSWLLFAWSLVSWRWLSCS